MVTQSTAIKATDYADSLLEKAIFIYYRGPFDSVFDPPALFRQAGFFIRVAESESMLVEAFHEINQLSNTKAIVVIAPTNCKRSTEFRISGIRRGKVVVSADSINFCSYTLEKSNLDRISERLALEADRISLQPQRDRLLYISLQTDSLGYEQIILSSDAPNDIVVNIEDMTWSYSDPSAKNDFRNKDDRTYFIGDRFQLNPKYQHDLKKQPHTIGIFDSGNIKHLENLANFCLKLGIPLKTDYE